MTREESIRIFRKEIECLSHAKCEDCILEKVCDPAKTTPPDSEYIEAYGMAIKALDNIGHLTDRPCSVCEFHGENGCSQWTCVFSNGLFGGMNE